MRLISMFIVLVATYFCCAEPSNDAAEVASSADMVALSTEGQKHASIIGDVAPPGSYFTKHLQRQRPPLTTTVMSKDGTAHLIHDKTSPTLDGMRTRMGSVTPDSQQASKATIVGRRKDGTIVTKAGPPDAVQEQMKRHGTAWFLNPFRHKEHNSTALQTPRSEIAAGTVAQPRPKKGAVAKRPGRVILVGNGKSMLKKRLGSVIDSYDVVGRYNYFQIRKHEAYVGRKTTLWFLGELKQPTSPAFDRSIKPERYVVPITWPATKNCVKCFPNAAAIKRMRAIRKKVASKWAAAGLGKRLEIMDESVEYDLRRQYKFREQWPSTGIQSVIYSLKYYEPPITLTGFDFANAKRRDCNWNGCSSNLLGHWFQKSYKQHTLHNMFAEGALLRSLAKRKLIKFI